MSRRTSSAPSNPAKRRKTGASQTSDRAHKIEEVDLRVRTYKASKEYVAVANMALFLFCCTILLVTWLNVAQDIDDDAGLSKVLEEQRMATIKAQKEQASKPLKLSTLQCIICMENMKDLTATHCGTFSLPTVSLTGTKFALFKVTSSATHVLWKP